ncbi:MAG: hypothetical protein JRJ79_05785 [Deltaproteobacteria bacterium]|nr:hypothetical protein [Deltaproteobacteria bacterium]
MKADILKLIRYITSLATEREEVLSPIRLVKFLYLADLYHARRNGGVTLTGWPWRFVHYGPFCRESLDAIKMAVAEGLIEAIPYVSQFDDEEHLLYRCSVDKQSGRMPDVPFYVTGPLQGAVRKWAVDTFALLDHVYFETEPMTDVHPGDLLDFSKASEPRPSKDISMKKLSKEKIARGKELVSKITAKQSRFQPESFWIGRERPIYDEAYFEAVNYLNESPLDFSIQGEARIEDSVTEFE